MRQGMNFSLYLEFPEIFSANRAQIFLIASLDHSVKSWKKFIGLSKPVSSMHFLTSILITPEFDEQPLV